MEVDLVESAIEGEVRRSSLSVPDRFDPPGVHQDDPIGELRGAEAVGDQEGGPVRARTPRWPCGSGPRPGCRPRHGGFIEDQDGRIQEHGSGQGDPLPLTP